MSVLHPSRTTRRRLPRRLIQIASLGLAGLLAGLLVGCSANPTGLILPGHEDTDWYTIPTYASETANIAPGSISRSAHVRPCFAAPCHSAMASVHLHPSHHHN
jgi:hypothetical protein